MSCGEPAHSNVLGKDEMQLIKQFLIILVFSFAGEGLHALLPLPIPASIYGIALLFTALEAKWVKVSDIDKTCFFLIEIMPIMFIPAAVGLLKSWDVVSGSLLQYAGVTVVSTFVVMYAAGAVTQAIIRKDKKRKSAQASNEMTDRQ